MDYSKIQTITKIKEDINFVDVYLLIFNFKNGTRDIIRYKSASKFYNDYNMYIKKLEDYNRNAKYQSAKQYLSEQGFIFETNMDITKTEINEGEKMLVLKLTKEVVEKYNNILKTRNLTPSQFINGALYLYENFTEKRN